MATATRSKKSTAATKRKGSQESKRAQVGQTRRKPGITVREKPGPDVQEWTCPACGWKKNSNADERCTSCDVLRPEVFKTQVEVSSLENGRTAWKCPVCQQYNDGREVSCLACEDIRPDLSDPEHMLLQALEPDRESTAVWRELRGVPTADEKLTEAVHAALIRQRPACVSTDRGYVSWIAGPEHEALAGSIGIWFARQFPPESGTGPAPDLIGGTLLTAVRRLYAIPAGRRAESGEPRAGEEEGKPQLGDAEGPRIEEMRLPAETVKKLIDSYSGVRLSKGQIKQPVEIGSQRFVCVGTASTGRDGYESVDFYEVRPRSEFRGKATRKDRHFEQRRNNPLGFYHGVHVLCGNERLVLVGPERRADGLGLRKIVEEKKQPRKEPKRRKPETAAEDSGPGPSALGSPLLPAGTRLDVPVEDLASSPFQPRTAFDAAGIQQLAESLARHGQTSDCLVRQVEGRFELIGGERRLRAAKKAKLTTLACRVIVADDAKARELGVFDNFDREDLGEVDRIRAYQGLLQAGVYKSQQELAAAIGLKPASLSNLLRILRLPADWLELISQEKLPLTHARYVVPWAERPAVLAELKKSVTCGRGVFDVQTWQWTIQRAVRDTTRPLTGECWAKRKGDQWATRHRVRLTKKDRERAELDVVEVKGLGQRAFNVELWEELQTAGEERAEKRGKGTKGQRGKGSKGQRGKGAKQREVTAAEARQQAEQKRKVFAERLWTYKVHWHQRQIAEFVKGLNPRLEAHVARLLQLLLYFTEFSHDADVEEVFAEQFGRCSGREELWKMLVARNKGHLLDGIQRGVAAWVVANPFDNKGSLSDEVVLSMAKWAGVEMKRDWRCERAYLELLTKEHLAGLAGEWKVTKQTAWLAGPRKKRTERIDGLLAVAAEKRLTCPKLLLSAKRPTGVYF